VTDKEFQVLHNYCNKLFAIPVFEYLFFPGIMSNKPGVLSTHGFTTSYKIIYEGVVHY